MTPANTLLDGMTDALQACIQGRMPQNAMIAQWRMDATHLPIPEKYGEVLSNLLDRMEASALFTEESCSFSQQGLFDNLRLWADKARAHCANPD